MLYPIIAGVIVLGFAIGIVAGYFIRKKMAQVEADSLESKMQTLVNEAKSKEQEILLRAKEKSLKIIDEAKKEEDLRREELRGLQSRLEKRETLFDQKLLDLESKQTKIPPPPSPTQPTTTNPRVHVLIIAIFFDIF